MFVFIPMVSNGQGNNNTSKLKTADDNNTTRCMADVKVCPDGSFVERKGPNCKFVECSGADSSVKVKVQNREQERESYDENDSGNVDQNRKQNKEQKRVGDVESATSTDKINNKNKFLRKINERKSRVADAVQEILKVSEKVKATVGEQIRIIAQEQNQIHEEAEKVVGEVSSRGGFARFFIGPNYSKIKDAEKLVEKYNKKLQKMGEVVAEVTAQDVVDSLNTQIQKMEQVKNELQQDIEVQKGGFSLFGWLNRLFTK